MYRQSHRRWGHFALCLSLVYACTSRKISAGPAQVAARGPSDIPLSFPSNEQSIETLEGNITALTLLPKHVMMLVKDRPLLIATAFPRTVSPTARLEARFADSKRLDLPLTAAGLDSVGWSAMSPRDEHLLLLNGSDLSLAYLDIAKKPLLISKHTLIFDLLRPGPDRGGEAPSVEIAGLRTKFRRTLEANPGVKIVGMAAIPAAWQATDTYVLATRLPGFPLLTMRCDPDNPSQCQLSRACPLRGHAPAPTAVAGIATHPSKRLILIGDKDQHHVLAYHFQACLEVRHSHTLALPTKVKVLTNLHIDQSENLWLSTEQPDDYYNASVYWWKKDQWLTNLN